VIRTSESVPSGKNCGPQPKTIMDKTSEDIAGLAPEETDWVNDYAAAVSNAFAATFRADDRMPDRQRLMKRFTKAVSAVLKHGFSKFSAVEDAHNELCIAGALLASENPRFGRLDYEPRLGGSAKSIDFRATTEEGLTVYVDVKTIQPKAKDRWDQFERAQEEKWFPDNVRVVLSKAWLGGEIWHTTFAARNRMLEYTLELERKIADAGLAGRENTFVILALCGAGFHWHVDQLEDFVAFYRTGRHRGDDSLAKVESDHIAREQITLAGTITRFACLRRPQGSTNHTLNWNVQPPRNLPF
jgi:hypothetical protein